MLGNPDVQKHDQGAGLVNQGDSFFRRAGLTHDLDVRLLLQTRPNPLPKHLVVVDDEHPYLGVHVLASDGFATGALGMRASTVVPFPGADRISSEPSR